MTKCGSGINPNNPDNPERHYRFRNRPDYPGLNRMTWVPELSWSRDCGSPILPRRIRKRNLFGVRIHTPPDPAFGFEPELLHYPPSRSQRPRCGRWSQSRFFEFGVGLQDGFGGIHGLIAVRRHRFHSPRNFLHTQTPSTSPGTVTFPGKVGYQELLLLHNVLR